MITPRRLAALDPPADFDPIRALAEARDLARQGLDTGAVQAAALAALLPTPPKRKGTPQ